MRYPFSFTHVARILFCVALALAAIQPLRLVAAPQLAQHDVVAQEADPDKPASEMNHHIAGMLLIAIGLSVMGSGNSRSLAWLRWLPPILFIAAGLFLAAWSDDEIWPRGNLAWSWLLHHDAEAFQHKLYAVLLMVLGAVEAIQASPKWRRPWLTVVFPVLCVIGAASLFFHQHSGHVAASGAPLRPVSSIASHHESVSTVAYAPEHVHGSAGPASEHMGHAGMAGTSPEQHHDHHLAGAAAKVQKQHAWFAVAGFLVALFKFLYDAARPPARVRQYLWASSVIFLGLLLLLYTE